MIYKIVGIGVGPANLSLASLLYPRNTENIFFDSKPRFDWHEGMQIPSSTLQVSLFKDLVTLSDPTSRFSFISYLHSRGRIYHFLNAQFDAVSRKEFAQYMHWASEENENVNFDEEVISVDFDRDFVVKTKRRIVRTENISIGVGKSPKVPAFAHGKLGPTMFHTADFMRKAGDLKGKRIVVIGGGQSGAEAVLDLISRPESEAPDHVTWVSRRTCFWPIDDTPFTNDLFMPSFLDYFSGLGKDQRADFIRKNILTSDGVSESTLRDIYQRLYLQQFVEERPGSAALLPNREVTQIAEHQGRWMVIVRHGDHDCEEFLQADMVILATGYQNASTAFLERVGSRIEREGTEYKVDGDYAAVWNGPDDRRIFLQNAVVGQKGLADPNLSLLAWRSQRIIDRLEGGVRTPEQMTSMIDWAPTAPDLGQKFA